MDYEGDDLGDVAFKIMISNKDFKEMFERVYIEVIYIMDYDLIPTRAKKVQADGGAVVRPAKD